MAKLKVYFENNEELNVLDPVWLVVSFGRGKFNWSAKQLYIPLEAPYSRVMRGEYLEEKIISLRVIREDLKHDMMRPDGFLIDIQSMLLRIKHMQKKQQFDHFEIDQFIIQMADIKDVTNANIARYYDWGF